MAHGELEIKSIRWDSVRATNTQVVYVYLDEIEQPGIPLILNDSKV